MLATDLFADAEEDAIKSPKIMTKARGYHSTMSPIKFSGTKIELTSDGHLTLKLKVHTGGISRVKNSEVSTTCSRGIVRVKLSPQEQYIAQRAKGAYIASICQPEASFDLFYAAQSTEFSLADIAALNKRLQWQLENKDRGLKYVKLDSESLQLVIFIDALFANDRDFLSHIGYIICLADSTNANIIHWSSVKCKRVARDVLAAKLYGLAHGFDISTVIKATLTKMLQRDIPLVLCTDSKFLYNCLVKLGIIPQKRLMIDVMSLRQLYERQEVTGIKWIHGCNNPADSMTKSMLRSGIGPLWN